MPRSINENFKKDTTSLHGQALWDHYALCLKQHDWSYQYSDDFQVWRVGQDERAYLLRMCERLSEFDKVKAEAMFAKHRPEGC